MGLSLPAIRVVPLTIRAYHSTRACTVRVPSRLARITTITLADLAHFPPISRCRANFSLRFPRVFSLFSILKFRTFQNYLYRVSSIRFLTSLQSAKIQRTMMRIKTASKQRERERFWFSVFNQEARSGCSGNIGAIIGQV